MEEMAIIGRIPGYNVKIDSTHEFEQELLKGITYIDMYPTSYTDSLGLLANASKATSVSNIFSTDALNFFGDQLAKLFESPGLVQSVPPAKSSTVNGQDPSSALFQSVLKRMEDSFGLTKGFAKKKSIRIVAANDSTFTEVFSNSFGAENVVTSMFESAKTMANNIPYTSQATKAVRSFDSLAMQNLVGFAHKNLNETTGSTTLASILSGVALGLNIAAPKIWSNSQYDSTLTLFIKLISPTGQPDCIRKNILEPLLYLIAASSPVTAYGVVYGYPLMWQVHAHGITNFRIGSVAALSIIRGSFETTFTKALQPTVVDVRLTIIPLLTDFASQTNLSNADSIYDKKNESFLGVQNPADVVRGTMNKGPVGNHPEAKTPSIVSVRI